MKKDNAEKLERKLLREFRTKFGKLPKYNITISGQYKYGINQQAQKKIVERIKQVNKHKR